MKVVMFGGKQEKVVSLEKHGGGSRRLDVLLNIPQAAILNLFT